MLCDPEYFYLHSTSGREFILPLLTFTALFTTWYQLLDGLMRLHLENKRVKAILS
jgi:hypothetical protein